MEIHSFKQLTTVCVSYVKPVKQITFLWHSITITSAVITKDRLEVISLFWKSATKIPSHGYFL